MIKPYGHKHHVCGLQFTETKASFLLTSFHSSEDAMEGAGKSQLLILPCGECYALQYQPPRQGVPTEATVAQLSDYWVTYHFLIQCEAYQ